MTIKLGQLLVACQEGHVNRVGEILHTGEVGVNAADELEITAIQVAAANNQDEVIDLLVAHGANVEATNNTGWSPVMQACYHGHTSTLNKLIAAGAKLNGRNRYGATPLNMAAAAGHLSTVRCLLEQGVPVEEDLPPQVASCPSPLMTAALHGRDAVLRTLLNRGAPADKAGTPGDWTPLMLASAGGSKPSAQILIERGANPDKMNLLGGTALEIAMATGNSECRAYLEKRTKTPGRVVCEASLDLIGAARMGDKARVEELLGREETDVDVTDSEGATPLILAAIAGHLAITQLLIGLGANLNHQDRVNGWTALMQATFYCHAKVAAALLHAGADPTVTAHNGCTALDLATLVDDTDCALIRQLATHTIRVAPPSLALEPQVAKRHSKMCEETFNSFSFNWSPAHLDIKTRTVEKTLEPLVMQVTSLVSSQSHHKSKGKSKRAHVLVAAVETAITNFVLRGESIAATCPGVKTEMLAAVQEVKQTGEVMSSTSREFAGDPCSGSLRADMVAAARNLLSAVTRLLILADMIDVNLLIKALRVVEDYLDFIRSVSSEADLMEGIGKFRKSSADLMSQAAKRQNELKDTSLRDDIAAARAVLKKHSMMLLSTSKAYVQHPELVVAKENRDYVLRQVCEAVNTISDVAQGRSPTKVHLDVSGELATALDEFDESVAMDPGCFNDSSFRSSLEERLESIISGAALLADSNCTREERRERIVVECNAVRVALQDLMGEYSLNSGRKRSTDDLDIAVGVMGRKTGNLRKQLRKAAVDHVSDSFLETSVPLLDLVEAARNGNVKDVDEYSIAFTEHVEKLVEVANLACSLSANEDGIKMVRYAAQYMENLYPQVINAAKILVGRPRSEVANQNVDIFKTVWENQLKILTDAVDDITTVGDFLAVSEDHILEDVNKCCSALQAKDAEGLLRIAGVIKGRSSRISGVIAAEMDNYEPGLYTENVLKAVRHMQAEIMPKFSSCVDDAVDVLTSLMISTVDENEFIDASRLVYDGIREVRRAVLMNMGEDDMDSESDTEWETLEHSEVGTLKHGGTTRHEDIIDEYPDISGITTAREAMKNLPEEEKIKIEEQVEGFKTEKMKFDKEVSKWDDRGNDVIGLAKRMCVIMMEMTDFTRGRGPLKTTMDVIHAAKKISEAGTKLDKLARQIADQCPESTTKKDLIAYLQRIALYCHQLNITSKVKADVQNVSGELIVSGLDSATSLIQAAKNLMNAVVLTVKASYVASTKYPKQAAEMGFTSTQLVVWKMKAPQKKPLVRRETSGEMAAVVRKGSIKSKTSPLKELSVFQSAGSSEKI